MFDNGSFAFVIVVVRLATELCISLAYASRRLPIKIP